MTEKEVTPETGDAEVRPFHDAASHKAHIRQAMMGEITKSARAKRAEALGLEPEPAPEPEPRAAAEPEPELEDEPAVEPETRLVTITVDGVEKQVPENEVIEQGVRALQKESAADERLQAAAEKLKQAEEAWAATVARQQEITPAAPPDEDVLRAKAKEVVTNLLDGPEDQAVEKLMDLVGAPQSPQIDQEEIIEAVTAKAMQRVDARDETKERAEAINNFRSTRADIAENEMLWNEADRFATVYASEHPDALPGEVLGKAAEHVDQMLEGLKPQSPETDFDEKRQRKQRATETMRQAGHRQRAPEPEPPPTRSDIINQRKKRLGQTVY